MKIIDLELYWFNQNHEDLPSPLFYSERNDSADNNSPLLGHGTAVMGILVAVDNNIGVTGIAHKAQAGYISLPTDTPSVANVANFLNLAATQAGSLTGIVLVELQGAGPDAKLKPTMPCTCLFSTECQEHGSVAVEYWQANYDVSPPPPPTARS